MAASIITSRALIDLAVNHRTRKNDTQYSLREHRHSSLSPSCRERSPYARQGIISPACDPIPTGGNCEEQNITTISRVICVGRHGFGVARTLVT
jgi:hypothetical protein